MGNPYREHIDKIQAMTKRLSREFLYTTAYEKDYSTDPGYLRNFVAVSGGQPFDAEFDRELTKTMKEVTDDDFDPTEVV